MTSGADVVPRRADVEPRVREALGVPRSVATVLAALKRLARPGPPDAAGLTDRQLADIGLTRADLPYDRDRCR